ncbi:MAG: class A beta-lactamase [Micropepsaceae bacterium]
MEHVSRRTVLAASAAFVAVPACARSTIDWNKRALRDLEEKSGGRLGVCAIDTASGHTLLHRGDERFAMCSTFKLPLAGAILRAADRGELKLDTVVPYGQDDMVNHAPVTSRNLDKGGMTIGALAEAAQKTSDNVAANLLVKQLGGPAAFTQILRDIGDIDTRLDRYEPEMNAGGVEGDARDTTTPIAMAYTTRNLLLGDVLKPDARKVLRDWMIDTKTGMKRLRAGLPSAWIAGDKTGTALNGKLGKYNDVAVAWPEGRAPIVIAAYFNVAQTSEDIEDRYQAVLADAARIAVTWAS